MSKVVSNGMEPVIYCESKVRPNEYESGMVMYDSTENNGTEKSIASTRIITRLVVKSDNFLPTLDS